VASLTKMLRFSIVLADKHALSSAGLKALVQEKTDLLLVNEVESKEQFGSALDVYKPSLLIVDYTIDNFISIGDLELVKKISPSTETLVIASTTDKEKILKVLQLGVKGYITKESSKEEIMLAIYAVSKGEKFYASQILDVIMEKQFPSTTETIEPSLLTQRESEVLALLAKGKSTQQIADKLFLSPHTVHTHRKSIIKKLNIKSPTQFVVHAIDLGLMKTKLL